jgi:hypothetical protein
MIHNYLRMNLKEKESKVDTLLNTTKQIYKRFRERKLYQTITN